MYVIYRKYGKVVEITEMAKKPFGKVRVYAKKRRSDVYSPRRLDNIRRTRQICVRRLLSALEDFGCPLLVTLTFAGDASDASYANDALSDFQLRLRDEYPQAQSLFIPELSPRGRIHFHGLVFNVPLRLGDTRKGRRTISHGTERETRTLATIWGEGYVDAVQTDGSPRLAYYISKYITKGAGEIMFNAMRIIRISHGFPKEIKYTGAFAERIAQTYANQKPAKVWEGDNMFLGKMTKKTYYKK